MPQYCYCGQPKPRVLVPSSASVDRDAWLGVFGPSGEGRCLRDIQEFVHHDRMWMALYMGASMAIIMLLFMLSMYRDRRTNTAIIIGSLFVFSLSLYLVRSQNAVDDVAWMKAMIPHHSIAILTSERAHISDPRVRELADEIISAQRREIREMELLIRDIESK